MKMPRILYVFCVTRSGWQVDLFPCFTMQDALARVDYLDSTGQFVDFQIIDELSVLNTMV